MKLWPLPMLLLAAQPALSEDLREFCGDRPGLGTPACTVDPGHVQVEVGLAGWTLDKQPDERTDTVMLDETLVRWGVGDSTEVRAKWSGFGIVRDADRTTGLVTHDHRAGDLTLSVKQNLSHPDGKELSIALLPFVSVPVGRRPVGAGDWGAGLLVPFDVDLTEKLQIQLTPAITAAVDEDGHGRHLAYGNVFALSYEFSDSFNALAEIQATRDRDPGDHTTQTVGGLSFAYLPTPRVQIDAGTVVGLNRAAPDVQLFIGVSRKF